MRLLADESFPWQSILYMRGLGHDVVWARTDFPGVKDSTLLDRAEENKRVLLTLDRDLWLLAVERPILVTRTGVILFRAQPATLPILLPLIAATFRA
jgi:predicted nuclease of predicted toxin-antitoxin system